MQTVNVTLGSFAVAMMVDTGCETTALPRALAVQLIEDNEATPDGTVQVTLAGGLRPSVWRAVDESRPRASFAGLWTRWTSVRNVKAGETTTDLFAFLTTEPNAEARSIPTYAAV